MTIKKCQARRYKDGMGCKRCKYMWTLESKRPKCKGKLTRAKHKALPIVIFGLDIDI